MKKILLTTLIILQFIGCEERSNDSKSKPIVTGNRDDQRDIQIPPRIRGVNTADLNYLPKLKPTTYFIARERNIKCNGRYRGRMYDGSESTIIRDMSGAHLAEVCTRFYKVLLMEGTAVLMDRGLGEFTLNYAKKVNGSHRFREMDKCIYGEGVKRNLCLIPFHTLATDRKAYNVGDIVYMPAAVDLILPDGSLHDGFFIVRDTGGAFEGQGKVRIDMFVGFQTDSENIFLNAGFHRGNPQKAYKVIGNSAKLVKDRMRAKFPDIY